MFIYLPGPVLRHILLKMSWKTENPDFGTELHIFSLIYFFYSKSGYKKNLLKTEKVDLIKKKSVEVIEEKIESSNIIQDVSYSAKDTKGNEYFLKLVNTEKCLTAKFIYKAQELKKFVLHKHKVND